MKRTLFPILLSLLIACFAQDSQTITSVSFSPDGSTLASGSKDKTFRLWDVATGEQK